MAERSIKSTVCAIIAASLIVPLTAQLNTSVYADNSLIPEREALSQAVALYEDLQNDTVQIPSGADLDGYDEDFLKAVIMGYANLSDADGVTAKEISKQDFMTVLYKTIINYDPSYAISAEETDAILNECYDNAYINDENRTAYAFMLKQGIITSNHNTNPDKSITRESAQLLINLVRNYFSKDVTITVCGNDITIGSNVIYLLDALGEPNRIDKSEYGFDWYVYNGDYSKFCMVGVEGGRVCALFTNCGDFAYGGLYAGCDFAETAAYEAEHFRFFSDADGALDTILYNPRDKGLDVSEELSAAKSAELLDIINSHRSKHSRTIYAEDNGLAYGAAEEDADVTVTEGYDVYSVYRQLLDADNSVLSSDSGFVSAIGLSADTNESGVTMSMVTSQNAASIPESDETVEIKPEEYGINEVDEIVKPVVVSPALEEVLDPDADVAIELEFQAANEYHIEVFDVESDGYAVNEYIKTDKTTITLPAELFVEGRDYGMVISSITEDGSALSAEEVFFSYGTGEENGIKITAPEVSTTTDDDYMRVAWESEAYSDFILELYNEHGELVTSAELTDEYEATIQGLDPGIYGVFVTALRKGTDIEKAVDSLEFEIAAAEPVINEIILDEDDVYYFVYEDETLGVLYLYDEELVDVDGVTKKKIIQKQVKATKGYRELEKRQSHMEFTTGEPVLTRRFLTTEYSSELGGAIVAEAEKYLGVNYVWGGTSPNGFDCSGLVQYCLNTLGIDIARVAEDQFNAGEPVSRDDLQPGDLVFFEQNGYIHHVGIYVGDNMMIHAPHTGDVVKFQSLDTEYYRREYAGARRVY